MSDVTDRVFSIFATSAIVVALAGALGGAPAFAESGRAGAVRGVAGSPDRGQAVYLSNGCAGCHALPAPGSAASVGPQLTPELLQASAASVGKPLGPFVAESILVPNAFVSPGYVSGLMRPFTALTKQQLDDLVSFLMGKPYTSPATGALKLPTRPVAACEARKACRATVARWAKVQRLPAAVLDGARITAVVGCLSCHRYAGSGVTSGTAPDLTRIGSRGISAARLVKQLSCPDCLVKGSAMPSFAALGKENLNRVAQFLRASKGIEK